MRVSALSVGLIQYFVGVEYVYATLINRDGKTQLFQLSSCANAVSAADMLLDVLERPYAWTPTQCAKVIQDFAEGWGRQLLPPADALRPFDVLIIVPHHFLHGVPFHLVSCDKEPLATSHGVAYCSSSTLLARCIERNRARQFDMRLWTFPSDNDDSPSEGPPVISCLSCGVDILTDKDAAYRELAHAFSAQFSNQANATHRNEIKGALATARSTETEHPAWVHPDAICLVCHGYYDPARADQSGLLLAGRRGTMRTQSVRVHGDTLLRINDLPFAEVPLRLDPVQPQSAPFGLFDPEVLTTSELRVHCETDAQLVALFGCSTGTGLVTSNDDYISHAYQWLKAGAASVIANLWEADFPIITEWAERFAVNWVQRRQPKAIAARNATRGLLVEQPALTGQLAVWGSLAVLGDWL
jgi:CHAT domain-containing protein